MKTDNLKSLAFVFFLFPLIIICGCKKQTQHTPVIQSDQNIETQLPSVSSESPYYVSFENLTFPRIFIKSKDRSNQSIYIQINGSQEDSSNYYIFPKYDVMTTNIPGVAGERIDVFKHISKLSDTLILTEADSIILTVGSMGTWFSKLIGDFLVIYITTGPGPTDLWVYNIVSRKRICNITYDGAQSWDGFILTSWMPIDSVATSINCPECKEWIDKGNQAGFEEEFTLDIRTGVKTKLGRFRCVEQD